MSAIRQVSVANSKDFTFISLEHKGMQHAPSTCRFYETYASKMPSLESRNFHVIHTLIHVSSDQNPCDIPLILNPGWLMGILIMASFFPYTTTG